MRLLFIGGTSFVGRHAVEAAVADGHDVTVFHRGRTNTDLLAGSIDHRHGDRDDPDYASLGDDEWDAVIDVCAYVPRHVDQLADAVARRTAHYVHISSISAYGEEGLTTDESSPLAPDLADPSAEAITNDTYGPLKAMCERAALAAFGSEATSIIRPTFVAGPHDTTDRFTYWARRMARDGDVAVVSPQAPLQLIDARDLGTFIVGCATGRRSGSFDAVGPWAPLAELLASIAPSGVDHRLVEVPAEALEAADTQLPLISADPPPAALMTRPGTAASAAGLSTRPLVETAESTRDWDEKRGSPPLKVGPAPEVEAALVR